MIMKHHKRRFQERLNNTLNNNTVRCKKPATIVLGQKYVAQPFVRQKQVSTSAEISQQRMLYVKSFSYFVEHYNFVTYYRNLHYSCNLWYLIIVSSYQFKCKNLFLTKVTQNKNIPFGRLEVKGIPLTLMLQKE